MINSPIKSINYLKQSNDRNSLPAFLALTAWNTYVHINRSNNENLFDSDYSSSFVINGYGYLNNQYDFFTAINPVKNDYRAFDSPPFPVAIRAIKNDVYVIERPPFKTTVRLTPKKAYRVREQSPILCEIWIPWTVCVLDLTNSETGLPSLSMFYNDGPLTSDEDILIPAWTPNVYTHGNVCWGESAQTWFNNIENKSINANNVNQIYHHLINDYFSGGWNLDLGYGDIYNVCSSNIGRFSLNPLADTELFNRSKNLKYKLKFYSPSFRESTFAKNLYLTWGLMDLEEVLEAVTLYKKSYINTNRNYTVKKFLSTNDHSPSEHDSIRLLISRMKSKSQVHIDWNIKISFSKEFIYSLLVSDYSLEDINYVKNSKYHLTNYICNSLNKFISENTDKLVECVNDNLNLISNRIFTDQVYNHEINISIEDILNSSSKESVSL